MFLQLTKAWPKCPTFQNSAFCFVTGQVSVPYRSTNIIIVGNSCSLSKAPVTEDFPPPYLVHFASVHESHCHFFPYLGTQSLSFEKQWRQTTLPRNLSSPGSFLIHSLLFSHGIPLQDRAPGWWPPVDGNLHMATRMATRDVRSTESYALER